MLEVDTERLGLKTGPDLQGERRGRAPGIGCIDDDSRDLVVGDAFGGVSVPWHLTTTEAVEEVRRVLRTEGVYAVNLIDYAPGIRPRRARDPARDLRPRGALGRLGDPVRQWRRQPRRGRLGVADRPAAVRAEFERQGVGWDVIDGARLTAWIDGAPGAHGRLRAGRPAADAPAGQLGVEPNPSLSMALSQRFSLPSLASARASDLRVASMPIQRRGSGGNGTGLERPSPAGSWGSRAGEQVEDDVAGERVAATPRPVKPRA